MYRGRAGELLGELREGDFIRVKRGKEVYEGQLMPRSELGDDEHVVLKLGNGYNIGLHVEGLKVELMEKRVEKKAEMEGGEPVGGKPRVSILGTGGTIASKIDYSSGAVHPTFSTAEIANAVPELAEIASLKTEIVFNILSENMKPSYWVTLAREVARELEESEGVVVAHGTDTLSYTASALAFMLGSLPKPVVLVGSQRSSDRPSSDSPLNLISSVRVALSDMAEVLVVMHSSSSDESCTIHRGTKVRKMHSSRRDAFRSINSPPLGEVRGGEIKTNMKYNPRGEGKVELDTRLEEDVALVKLYPGFPEKLMDCYLENCRGLVIEGTGLGHAAEGLISKLEMAIADGMPVVMTTQTLYGRVNMKVYSTGRRLLRAGVIPGGDMLPEVAYVKLMVAMGRYCAFEKIEKFMQSNIAGEISERSLYNTFF